jgi:hypothetical protein
MAISLIKGAGGPSQRDMHCLIRDRMDTQESGRVMAGVVYVTQRDGRGMPGDRVINQFESGRQELPGAGTCLPGGTVQTPNVA